MRLWSEVQGHVDKDFGTGERFTDARAAINKAEAEEQAKLAQSKLSKGVKHEASVEIAAVEVNRFLTLFKICWDLSQWIFRTLYSIQT